MQKYIFLGILAISFLYTGCGVQPYVKENSAFIVFKTPTFKYADMGFIYQNKEEVKVEIYGNGQALTSLKITDDSVCMSLFECMSKQHFNTKILQRDYPKDILENIFRGKPIFSSRHLQKNRNGFTQNIINKNKYDIHYSVLKSEIIFRDTINTILIKIKKQ